MSEKIRGAKNTKKHGEQFVWMIFVLFSGPWSTDCLILLDWSMEL